MSIRKQPELNIIIKVPFDFVLESDPLPQAQIRDEGMTIQVSGEDSPVQESEAGAARFTSIQGL